MQAAVLAPVLYCQAAARAAQVVPEVAEPEVLMVKLEPLEPQILAVVAVADRIQRRGQ